MSSYKYIIRDYHAIREAVIKLDGITVLSGINGCGKSTLSKWLYCLVNGTNRFDTYLFSAYKDEIIRVLFRIQFICDDLERSLRFLNNADSYDKNVLQKQIDSIRTLIDAVEIQNDMEELCQQTLLVLETFQNLALAVNLPDTRKVRIMNFLNINSEKEDLGQAVIRFKEQYSRKITGLIKQFKSDIEKRPLDRFNKLAKKNFDVYNDIPPYIQLEEDGVNLIEEGHVSTLYNLRRAVYIDTPMALAAGDAENVFWKDLRGIMMNDNRNNTLSFTEKKFRLRIVDLLDGETVVESDEFIDRYALRYVSKDLKINILLKDTATGYKTFSYLQRLLENGLLRDDTLLMIDEPEAHLHPQWIVEFARLLVLLHKELGLKIMIASHNPDMVAAIHDIANKEEVLKSTNFYVAKPVSQNSHQYVFKDLGHEVGEIFESFNIALDAIGRYGRVDFE